MSTRSKITNPYGVPTSDLIHDSTKDEARRIRRERFGGPHRSEKGRRDEGKSEKQEGQSERQERSPTPERNRSPRRPQRYTGEQERHSPRGRGREQGREQGRAAKAG